MNKRIAVFGAHGHTARFVIAELRQRGWEPRLSGRDTSGHGGLDRLATIDDPPSLDRALAGCAAVINCAGPFGETAPALVEAALRAKVHYLDITGEALVALRTFETFGERQGLTQVIAPCMGFFGVLGDLLATAAMADWPRADEILVGVALDGWRPTRGTRLAGARRAGRRVVYASGRLVVKDGHEPPPSSSWTFPAPFGVQPMVGEFSTVDLVTIARHLATTRLEASLNLAPLQQLSDPLVTGPEAADESGRSSQRFLVEVVVRRAGDERRAVAAGQDIYAITAPIVVEALERILTGRCGRAGVIAAGEAFDARDFLRALPLTRLELGTPAPASR
jgi:short subunit dehydrogenase-like uncharacterized protein